MRSFAPPEKRLPSGRHPAKGISAGIQTARLPVERSACQVPPSSGI